MMRLVMDLAWQEELGWRFGRRSRTIKEGLRKRSSGRYRESTAYPEGLKYRLAYIPPGRNEPAVLYDVHPGKGHHRHIKGIEFPYEFLDVRQLRVDFEADVERVMKGDRR